LNQSYFAQLSKLAGPKAHFFSNSAPTPSILCHGADMIQAPEKIKILMVDDEPKNLLELENVLESLGHELVRAHSGAEALKRLAQNDFAVILLDVQMPEMDGFETATKIRSQEKFRISPIVFLTELGKSEAEMFRGYEVGAVDYLLKPFSPNILRYKVRGLVELHQNAAEIKWLNLDLLKANADLEFKVQERTEALEDRGKALARSNQELAQFAAVASHDLQEPLRTLTTYLQLIQKNNESSLNEEDAGFMDIVISSAKRMRQLINDLLSFSQIAGGDRKLESVDCGGLVHAIHGNLKKMFEEKGAEITVGALPTLPAESQLLQQVFQNLIENALKFYKGLGAKIEVTAHEKGAFWVFRVKDDGIGIAPEHFDKIFKIFQRLHTRDEYSGSGMGLSICKKIVERHGGEIWLDSAPDLGSTFYFSIPSKG
jgi:signal transduction histidine kinase